MGHIAEKSYWVKFEDTYVMHHEAYGYRKKTDYKEAKYIVIGSLIFVHIGHFRKRFMKNWVIISMFYLQINGYYFLFVILKNLKMLRIDV